MEDAPFLSFCSYERQFLFVSPFPMASIQTECPGRQELADAPAKRDGDTLESHDDTSGERVDSPKGNRQAKLVLQGVRWRRRSPDDP
jgi:hypothetical protein